ncbi:hypothetical protein FJZ28_02405 [Candidatus Peregrinibacteria bacterium]|nr:hypothetical protein [Candidatus Peregrinibacteria bacterium]
MSIERTTEQAEDGKPSAEAPIEEKTSVNIEQTITKLLTAAATDPTQLASCLAALDRHIESSEQSKAAVESALPSMLTMLRQHPYMLKNLNHASTIAAPGQQGPAYKMLMNLLAQSIETLSPDECIKVIESQRRAKQYDAMSAWSTMLREKLGQDDSRSSWSSRSKISYEEHMALRVQGVDLENQKGDQAEVRRLYEQAVTVAEQSEMEARKGGDPVDGWYAVMSKAGFLLPRLGRNEEAIRMLEMTIESAETYAQEKGAEIDQTRVARTIFNMTMHSIDLEMQVGADPAIVRALIAKLESNSVFQEGMRVDPVKWEQRLASARIYCEAH